MNKQKENITIIKQSVKSYLKNCLSLNLSNKQIKTLVDNQVELYNKCKTEKLKTLNVDIKADNETQEKAFKVIDDLIM